MALKLIKHDFKNTWLEITIVCSAIIAFSFIFGVAIKLETRSYFFTIMAVLTLGLLYIAAVAIVIINIVRSIHKKLFSDEGYLTLTLPVSIDQLLISKVLVNFVWICMTFITFLLSILIIGATVGDFMFTDMLSFIYEQPLMVILGTVFASVEAIVFIITLVLVLGLLNTGRIKKFKLLCGIIFYYLIVNVLSWVKALVRIIPYAIMNGQNGIEIVKTPNFYNFYLGPLITNNSFLDLNNLLFNLIAIVGFYFLSRYIIKNKLELE